MTRRRADEAAAVPEARAPEAAESLEAEENLADDERDGDAAPDPEPAPPAGLDERGREVLAFERQWWKHAGAKEQAIRDRFEMSATRYYQVLNTLIDDPAALAEDPVLVGRLRRLRASRTRRTT